jgi:hypothetical protein
MKVRVLFSFFNPFLTYVSLLETERPYKIVTPHAEAKIDHLHFYSL